MQKTFSTLPRTPDSHTKYNQIIEGIEKIKQESQAIQRIRLKFGRGSETRIWDELLTDISQKTRALQRLDQNIDRKKQEISDACRDVKSSPEERKTLDYIVTNKEISFDNILDLINEIGSEEKLAAAILNLLKRKQIVLKVSE